MYVSAKPPLTGYPLHRVSLSRRKAVVALQLEILNFIKLYGLDRTAFFTIRCPADTPLKVAQACLNNASRRFLKDLFPAYIAVVEVHDTDRPHFHLLVATRQDYRTGFNFDHYHQMKAITLQAYREGRPLTIVEKQERGVHARQLTSNPALKAMWKQLREKLPQFGFSTSRPAELVPIEKNAVALAFYMTKQFTVPERLQVDAPRGARLIRYSQSYVRVVPKLADLVIDTPGRRRYDACKPRIAEILGHLTDAQLASNYGRRWAYRCWEVSQNLHDTYGYNPIPWESPEVLAVVEEIMANGYVRPPYDDGLNHLRPPG